MCVDFGKHPFIEYNEKFPRPWTVEDHHDSDDCMYLTIKDKNGKIIVDSIYGKKAWEVLEFILYMMNDLRGQEFTQ